MAKVKKVPQRKCVGCNQVMDKKQLIRVVKTSENIFLVDRTGKKSGRGAYICPNKDCLLKAIKTKGLEKSFKEKISEEVYSELKAQYAGEGDE